MVKIPHIPLEENFPLNYEKNNVNETAVTARKTHRNIRLYDVFRMLCSGF